MARSRSHSLQTTIHTSGWIICYYKAKPWIYHSLQTSESEVNFTHIHSFMWASKSFRVSKKHQRDGNVYDRIKWTSRRLPSEVWALVMRRSKSVARVKFLCSTIFSFRAPIEIKGPSISIESYSTALLNLKCMAMMSQWKWGTNRILWLGMLRLVYL